MKLFRLAFLVLLSACDRPEPPAAAPTSPPVPPAPVVPSEGEFKGVDDSTAAAPEGALTKDDRITITESSFVPPDRGKKISKVYEVATASGRKEFGLPILVELPYDPAGVGADEIVAVYSQAEGQTVFVPFQLEPKRGKVSILTRHFCPYWICAHKHSRTPTAEQAKKLRASPPTLLRGYLTGVNTAVIDLDMSTARYFETDAKEYLFTAERLEVNVRRQIGRGNRVEYETIPYTVGGQPVILDAMKPVEQLPVSLDPAFLPEWTRGTGKGDPNQSAPGMTTDFVFVPLFRNMVRVENTPPVESPDGYLKAMILFARNLQKKLGVDLQPLIAQNPLDLVMTAQSSSSSGSFHQNRFRNRLWNKMMYGGSDKMGSVRDRPYIYLDPTAAVGETVSHEFGHYITCLLYDLDFSSLGAGMHDDGVSVSRSLAFSEDLATFFGALCGGENVPSYALIENGDLRMYAKKPRKDAQRWPNNRKLDPSTVESVPATILWRASEGDGLKRIVTILKTGHPLDIHSFFEQAVKGSPADFEARLQRICFEEGVCRAAQGRVECRQGSKTSVEPGIVIKTMDMTGQSCDPALCPLADRDALKIGSDGSFSVLFPLGRSKVTAELKGWKLQGEPANPETVPMVLVLVRDDAPPRPAEVVYVDPAKLNVEGRPLKRVSEYKYSLDFKDGGYTASIQVEVRPAREFEFVKDWGPMKRSITESFKADAARREKAFSGAKPEESERHQIFKFSEQGTLWTHGEVRERSWWPERGPKGEGPKVAWASFLNMDVLDVRSLTKAHFSVSTTESSATNKTPHPTRSLEGVTGRYEQLVRSFLESLDKASK